jgi:hypothetical protein
VIFVLAIVQDEDEEIRLAIVKSAQLIYRFPLPFRPLYLDGQPTERNGNCDRRRQKRPQTERQRPI